MPSPFTGISGTWSVGFGGTDPLILAGQSLLANPSISDTLKFANGLVATGNAIDAHYEDVGRTLATGTNIVYTLSDLVDTLPRTNVFIDIRGLMVIVRTRMAGDYLTIGPNSTHGWTAWIPSGTVRVYRSISFAVDLTDSLAVAAGSNDQLKIANAGSNNITFDFAVVGNTA